MGKREMGEDNEGRGKGEIGKRGDSKGEKRLRIRSQ